MAITERERIQDSVLTDRARDDTRLVFEVGQTLGHSALRGLILSPVRQLRQEFRGEIQVVTKLSLRRRKLAQRGMGVVGALNDGFMSSSDACERGPMAN